VSDADETGPPAPTPDKWCVRGVTIDADSVCVPGTDFDELCRRVTQFDEVSAHRDYLLTRLADTEARLAQRETDLALTAEIATRNRDEAHAVSDRLVATEARLAAAERLLLGAHNALRHPDTVYLETSIYEFLHPESDDAARADGAEEQP
jgi:hypothetical protein